MGAKGAAVQIPDSQCAACIYRPVGRMRRGHGADEATVNRGQAVAVGGGVADVRRGDRSTVTGRALAGRHREHVGRTCFECAREYETPDLWANELPYDWRPFDEYEAASKSFLSDYSRETTH